MPHDLRRRLPAIRLFAVPLLPACALALVACTSVPPAPEPPPDSTQPVKPASKPAVAPAPVSPPAEPVASAQPPKADLPAGDQDLLEWSLAYAERLRLLPAADVGAEVTAIGEPGGSAQRQMQLALALLHAPPPTDTARVLGLLQRLISHPAPEATPLKPLARLLAGRLQAQRRLEDSNERLNQQWREAQRRIELLGDQLDAMRAIERSLSPRPAAPGGR